MRQASTCAAGHHSSYDRYDFPSSDTATGASNFAGGHPASGYCRTTSANCESASNHNCGKVVNVTNNPGVVFVGKDLQYRLYGGTAAVRHLLVGVLCGLINTLRIAL